MPITKENTLAGYIETGSKLIIPLAIVTGGLYLLSYPNVVAKTTGAVLFAIGADKTLSVMYS